MKHTDYEASHYAVFFSSLLPLSAPISITFSVRDQVSHPYKITGKIIVLYVLIFMFLEQRW